MNEFAIETKNLTRRFGELIAVNSLDLQIEKGLIYGFLGPNGCGKTTSIRLLTGLIHPSEGSVQVLGHSLPREAESLRLKIGYMTQKFSLYDDLTVIENLQFMARIYGIAKSEQNLRIKTLIDRYDLTSQKNQLAGSMSGGQKQRLGLAAAVIHKPALLFLDEPTSAVDPENRRDFWEKLFDLSEKGTTILVSTHYMDEAERCHKIAILEDGYKRADDTPENLMKNLPANVVQIVNDTAEKNNRQIKQLLSQLPGVISASQIGNKLRVMVKKSHDNAQVYLEKNLPLKNDLIMSRVPPSLEDVFVASTGNH